jgi:hypothetical protein
MLTLEKANWWSTGGLLDDTETLSVYKTSTSLYSSGSWHGSFGNVDETKKDILTPGGQPIFGHCLMQISSHDIALIGGATRIDPTGNFLMPNTNVRIFVCFVNPTYGYDFDKRCNLSLGCIIISQIK